jgi:hypothetical protein
MSGFLLHLVSLQMRSSVFVELLFVININVHVRTPHVLSFSSIPLGTCARKHSAVWCRNETGKFLIVM